MRVLDQKFSTSKLVLACAVGTKICVWGAIEASAADLPSPSPRVNAAPPAGNIATDNAAYVTGPGDILSVVVLKHPEFSDPEVSVPGDGSADLPVVGNTKLAGKTLRQIQNELTVRLRVRLLHPEVVVTLNKPRPRPVYVLGPVRIPGEIEFRNGFRVTDTVAVAGGLIVSPDRVSVTVTRGNKKLIDTALAPLLNEPGDVHNLALTVGDTVRFYERVVSVQVVGAVAKPGPYDVEIGGGIVEAVGLAGGPTEEASLSRSIIRRVGGPDLKVDLYRALRLGEAADNIKLVAGDTIVVPQFKDRISVLGAVKLPGFVGVDDDRETTVADAIARAGGPADNAALTQAKLRRDGVDTPVDLYAILVKGDKEANVRVHKDDLITVPAAKGITILGSVSLPGNYKLEEGASPRISDVLAKAGGLNVKPEAATINISRVLPDGKQLSMAVDAVGLLQRNDPSQNGRVQDGDIVTVSVLRKLSVFVTGQVVAPGNYDLDEDSSVPDAIVRAGGPNENASLRNLKITRRDGEVVLLDISDAVRKGGIKVNVPLRDGDYIVVPLNRDRINVLGAVTKQGSYPLAEDRPTTVADALSMAGGARDLDKIKQIALLRQGPKGQEQHAISVNPKADSKYNLDVALQPGDYVYVPDPKGKTSLFGPVIALAGLAARYIIP